MESSRKHWPPLFAGDSDPSGETAGTEYLKEENHFEVTFRSVHIFWLRIGPILFFWLSLVCYTQIIEQNLCTFADIFVIFSALFYLNFRYFAHFEL